MTAKSRDNGPTDPKICTLRDNVHMNTKIVQCILTVYSTCPYKYNQ